MNILGVGPAELVLIFVIALIFFGPGRLPELARTLGKAMGELRRMSAEVTAEFTKELQDVEDITREMKETTETIKQAADIKTLVESVEPTLPSTSPSKDSGHRTAGESREEPESPHVQETATQPEAEKEDASKGERD
jgi:sec-independent protein translocase protein TatB